MHQYLQPPGFHPPPYNGPPLKSLLHLLKKHRKKNSLFFLIKWTWFKKPQPEPNEIGMGKFLQVSGRWEDKRTKQWYYIYTGLKEEYGMIKALTIATDIIHLDKLFEGISVSQAREKYLKEKYGESIPLRFLQTISERKQIARKNYLARSPRRQPKRY